MATRALGPVYIALMLGFACHFMATTAMAIQPCPVRMFVDGALQTGSNPRVPGSANSILFSVGQAHPDPARGWVRYQLKGYETEWHYRAGTMAFSVCFFDRKGAQLSQKTAEIKGKSSGWNESLEKVSFTHRREIVKVPDRAEKFWVKISSAGPSTTVGVYLIKDVTATLLSPGSERPKLILESSPSLRGGEPEVPSPKWVRDGTRPGMSTILETEDTNERIFCIVDEDSDSHAEWRSSLEGAASVQGGDQVAIEWNEAYFIGDAGGFNLDYKSLPPGKYALQVQQIDAWAHPLAEASSFEFVVPVPYWQQPWVWALGVAMATGAIYSGGRWCIRIRVRRHLQKVRLVEQERLRISRDLHDDLGARLTHISLMSSHAGSKSDVAEATATLKEISSMSRELIAALSEVIWTVNPENDHLEALVSFLCQQIDDQCAPAGVRCRVDALGVVDERTVRSEIRHHTSLAVKEAVNNALKHSKAEEIRAQIRFEEPLLTITISDDGNGKALEKLHRGNGLINMRQRMAAIRGRIGIESAPGHGTTVRFEVPIG